MKGRDDKMCKVKHRHVGDNVAICPLNLHRLGLNLRNRHRTQYN